MATVKGKRSAEEVPLAGTWLPLTTQGSVLLLRVEYSGAVLLAVPLFRGREALKAVVDTIAPPGAWGYSQITDEAAFAATALQHDWKVVLDPVRLGEAWRFRWVVFGETAKPPAGG